MESALSDASPATVRASCAFGYFDVVAKSCETDECVKRPTYGLVRGKALSCAAHKLAEYFDVVSKSCDGDGCTKQPIYGLVLFAIDSSGPAALCRCGLIESVGF